MKKEILILAAVVTCSVLNGCTERNEKDIGESKAQEIAIADSGVNKDNLSRLKVSREQDDFKIVYDVEFTDQVKGMEYDYEILASDGSIYSFESEKFERLPEKPGENHTQVKISQDEASKLALDKVAGATAANLSIRLEREKNAYVYDGEIVYNQKEYDFEIDADTGEFLEWREKSI